MKRNIIVALALMISLSSCTADKSIYAPQQKEEVTPIIPFEPDGNDQNTGSNLKPGINKVNLEVILDNGDTTWREFKYYLPISINPSKPISLIFNFHGNISYATGAVPPDPIFNVSALHPLNAMANTNNVITVWPAGTAEPGSVGWQVSDKHIPFVNSMVEFFKVATPKIDTNRIYACGHSSGAIFSFVLASQMSDVFAAVCPVAGQLRLAANTPLPPRTVPIRAFNGDRDATVQYQAAYDNFRSWVTRMGGYQVRDIVVGQAITAGDYICTPHSALDGNGDLELYALKGVDHNVNWANIIPLMWEFMDQHPLDKSVGLYIAAGVETVRYEIGKKVSTTLYTSRGVTVRIVSSPAGFTSELVDNKLEITAGSNAVDGKIVLEGSLDGKKKNVEITLTKK
ncbi:MULTISPECIES: alpha/beta hydrolase family esterase [Sphingobacterium]|uniref:alpha/beta hydrolase family esterase n=1 Tax=Sphingobacterium TaxID=28453 RepID=UPI0013DB9FC0|nr:MULTISPECIES: hypothetical protein [unclassified Sphingobacterium]